jgi:ParB-like chromosome segregation protein Spo0J
MSKTPAPLKAGARKIPVTRLIADARNYKEINPVRLADLMRDIAADPEHFQARPIICDQHGVIIGGEQRWRAAAELKWKTVPGFVIVDPTPARRREIMIRDNTEYGEPLEGALAELVAEQEADPNADLAALGLPEEDLQHLLEVANPDFTPGGPDGGSRLDQRMTRTIVCPHCKTEIPIQGTSVASDA